jgi:hypothetical protein
MMTRLGALPNAAGVAPAQVRPLAWADVYATLTSPFAGPALVEMTQPAPGQ